MRFGLLFVAPALLATFALASCSGGGSSASRPASVLPASAAGMAPPAAPSATRRTQSQPTCTGGAQDSFEGGGTMNAAGGAWAVVGGGIGDYACDENSSILGGAYNGIGSAAHASEGETVGGGYGNWITYGSYSIIGAGVYNSIGSAAGTASFVGAGEYNVINADYGTVAGGYENSVSSEYGAIAGGEHNAASGEGSYIGGGGYNTASGEGAIVDGGFNQTAAGTFATIPGGYANSAAGTYSLAAGARASAGNTGAFVWSDGSDGDTMLTSSRSYQFLARASGGVTFLTNAAGTVGATLAAGSGTWASASDRNLKTDVARIDDVAVLDKVASLPISRWSYKSERGVRHVGPMAQDFYAAFGVGEDDKHITSIDEDGVALAAIKALHTENAQLRDQQKKMQMQLDRLVATVSALRSRP